MKTLGILFCVIYSISCAYAEENRVLVLNGRIDSNMVEKVIQASDEITGLKVSSSGGFPSQAISILKIADERQYNLEIGEVCVSACAEYILPVAQNNPNRGLHFVQPAFIGFHWNAHIIEKFVRENIETDISHCPFNDSNELTNLQKTNSANANFWTEVLMRLGENRSQVRLDEHSCPQVKMLFENQIWLPTSQQLKDLFWLEFSGPVCADDFYECSNQINDNFPPNIKFIIGEKGHISR